MARSSNALKVSEHTQSYDALLLGGARRLLREGGAAALTIPRLAAIVGSSVASVSQYYASREGVLVALVDDHHAAILSRLEREVIPTLGRAPLRDAVRRTLEVVLRRLGDDASVLAVAFTDGVDDRGRPLLEVYRENVEAAVRYAFDRCPTPVRMRDVELAVLLVARATLTETFNVMTGSPSRADDSRMIDYAVNVFERYVA